MSQSTQVAIDKAIASSETRKQAGNEQDIYLVWSNQHHAWWGPSHRGYERTALGAGRYTRAEALQICADAIPEGVRASYLSEIPVRLMDLLDMAEGSEWVEYAMPMIVPAQEAKGPES